MAFGSWQTLEIPLFWKLSGTTNFGKRYFMKKKKKVWNNAKRTLLGLRIE